MRLKKGKEWADLIGKVGTAEAGLKMEKLSADKLRLKYDISQFKFKSTEEVKPLTGTIGQERAVEAIKFGLQTKADGFNIFVSGLPGTGRTSTVRAFVEEYAKKLPPPKDYCYLFNFKKPEEPIFVELDKGKGKELAEDMEKLIIACKKKLPHFFKSDEYFREVNTIKEKYEAKKSEILESLQKEARKYNFEVLRRPAGLFAVPLKEDGTQYTLEELEALPKKEKEKIEKAGAYIKEKLDETFHKLHEIDDVMREEIKQLDEWIVKNVVGRYVKQLKAKYQKYKKLKEYFDGVKEYLAQFTEKIKSLSGEEEPDFLFNLKVNVFVDNSHLSHAPLVFEPNPTYYNLFGRIEYKSVDGNLVTHFTLIKPGAFHRANGGFLIIPAKEALLNPFVWDALKRAIRTKELRIENIGEELRQTPVVTLRPEPIPHNVKVILIGTPLLYHLLHEFDEDFRKLFKVKADFDTEMPRTKEHIDAYISFIAKQCRDKNLKHFDPSGVARILEYGSELTGDQDKLSTKFIEVVDVITEASFWAEQDGSKYVTAEHVEKALEKKRYRVNLIEEKIHEEIKRGRLLIDVEGKKVGQVNGLTVVELGDYSFGYPVRVTARVYMGKKGILNIEREIEMSGPIHSKGVLILSAYLAGKYAHNKPLSLSASICFEQMYEEIEGDSASSTELYALLSCLSGLPIRQDLAVTGSVNQWGEIQPIGGVNEKIEGFFRVCKAKGLTGTQGVIIPYQNIKNLMLNKEVVKAVEDGKFHIYAIKTIDEGIELLTGVKAGKLLPDGTYEPDTVNYLVDQKLREMAELLKGFEEHE